MSFVLSFHSLRHFGSSFLTFFMKPVFMHGLSGFLHLLLLVTLLVSLVWKKVTVGARESSKENVNNTLFARTRLCSLVVSAFNLLLFLFDYFCWYRNGWSQERLVTILDLVLKMVAWGVGGVCLHKEHAAVCFQSSRERRLPFFFRAWCVLYLFVSSYCIIGDIVLREKHAAVPIQCIVSDVFSVCVGLFFCYLGFFVKNEDGVGDTTLQESLLNNDSKDSDAFATKETKAGDIVSPYSNAGVFVLLTFSWVGPLIAVGKKKTLDLKDVPQLDKRDSLIGVFPTFSDKLEAYCGATNTLTALKLVKSLVFSAWKEIIFTAILALVNTLATFVGPYLTDGFVQYLNGKRQFENEGPVLVSAFLWQSLWSA